MFYGLILPLLFVFCQQNTAVEDRAVFRYNEFRNITSLDPAFARNPQNIWPIQQVFNGLVQLDDSLNVIPEIAHKWEIDSLGKTYTFYLRQDVEFHPSPSFGDQKTRKVVAADFTYSFDRLTDPTVGSPGGWVMQQVESYQALNDSVFRIHLKQAFPAFISLLSMRYCSVVPKEVIEDTQHDFRKHPIGTGPFKFKAWEEDVKLVLRKNSLYFEKDDDGHQLPYLEAIAISFLPDIQSEFMLFSKGKFDFLNSLDPSYKDELLTPSGELQEKYSAQIQIQKGPYLNTEYIGFYMDSKNPALQSAAIRKAINIGFDREKMIKYLQTGNLHGVAAQTQIVGDDFCSRGLNAWRAGRFTEGERTVIGTPTLFLGDILRENPYDSSRKFSDDSELCERWAKEFGARFAISNAYVLEVGKTSWQEVRIRAKMYGISDHEIFIENSNRWTLLRKAKSLSHPITSDFVTPVRHLPLSQAASAIPFLGAFTALRYAGWITSSLAK